MQLEVMAVYVVYLDILFLINIVMDIMIFYIAAMVLNKVVGVWRIISGSLVASLLACLLIGVPWLQRIPYPIYTLFIPVVPIIMIYKPMQIKAFLKVYIVCIGIAMLIGGATFSTWYMLGYTTAINSINIIGLLSIGLIIGAVFYFSFDKIRKRLILPAFEYDITITYADKKVYIKSILDTGNCLYTPMGHKAVIVVTYEALKELFTDEQEVVINKYKNDILELLCTNIFESSYIIPFNSVGCKAGMLLGIEVDQVSLYKNNFEKKVEKCIVGITFNNIFHDQAYKALLHPDFILN